METIQSVLTIEYELDRSVYKVIKYGYRIKINCLESLEAEMLNRNIKLWNSSITIYYSNKRMFTPFLQYVWPVT